jgi:hypothetical protein
MGFYAYIIPPGLILDNIDLVKAYVILDNIHINFVGVNDQENITIGASVNVYNSYEERLLRVNPLMFTEFSIEGLIDKNFSENLWNKCYIRIKELLINKNTQNLKEAILTLREIEATPHIESFIMDPISGIEIAVEADYNIIVETIPTEYQYLLEIDDHFN